MIITISGVPGSGKTTVGKIIAQKLGMPFYSVGGLRGKMALERGLTIDELNKLGETDRMTDTQVDEYQKELGTKEDGFVIEGRLSWHFIPHSFKIFLDCEPEEAAHRILASRDERPDEELPADTESMELRIEARLASDQRRYQDIYGLDYRDKRHYDLVLDTSSLKSAEETAERILADLRPRLDASSGIL
jgi:cytidylate kinase